MPAEIHYLRKTSRIGATYEHRPQDWRFSRDQREAGIADYPWEDRIPPMRSWVFWLAVAGSWAVFAGAIWGMAALLANI
jgi:hypothetical protein